MVQRAAPGQTWEPPLARDWNDIGEATEAYLRDKRAGDSSQLKQWIVATEWMWCKNTTGNRRAGEILEAGAYLLATLDPFSPWFEGRAPTDPVENSTHGVLRVACAADKIERVQVSGIVRAWVNINNTNHHFCDASPGLYVLQSSAIGPHKIVYKPSGTGEKECFVLLYAAADGEVLAEAVLLTDMCPDDAGGTGTGAEQTVEVFNARLMPGCFSFTPDRVVNPHNHHGPAGSSVVMYRRRCSGGDEEWVILDVELRKFCAVAGVEDRPSCLVGWGLRIGAEWCPQGEPDEACVIVDYTDCDTTLPECDTTLNWDPLYACCYAGGSGWGSGSGSGSGSGT